MKNWIYSKFNLKKVNPKKTTARIALIAILVNIVSPGLTYAALPDFTSNLVQPNVLAVAQVNKVVLPRVLVSWDLLELTISWTTVSQIFDTDSLTTANELNTKIDALQEVDSNYDDNSKTFTITSSNPWTPFSIWDLQITRTSITPTTPTPNVVAVAQVWEVNIPQQLFNWDTINFLVDGTSIVENFSWDKDTTLTNFANQITNSTSASWSYDSINGKVILTAKVAWTAFSMSNLIISSNWINVNNITPNVVPVAQVEELNIPRVIYSDETISLTIDWSWITQSYNTSSAQTLSDLNDKINDLASVNSSIIWWVITITAANPWTAFVISNLTISNGTINWINIVPNQVAVAQEDIINIPRDLYLWDTINFDVWWSSLAQWFSMDSDYTISQLINQINTLPNVYVSAYAPILRTLTIKSKAAWTAFVSPTLNISSNISSTNLVNNVVAQKQISEYTLSRTLVSWDSLSAIINWSPISATFSWSSTNTISSFINEINSSMSWVINASATGSLWIHLESVVSWNSFTLQPLNLSNSINPTVVVANVVPVKQKETIIIPNDIISWDSISLNLSWTTVNTQVTQAFNTDETTTLNALKDQINNLADFSASLNWKNLVIESKTAWKAISVSNFKTDGTSFSWVTNTWNISEIKANLNLTVNNIPSQWDNLQIGDCNVWFSTWSWDLNCNNNTANININALDNDSLASMLSSLSNLEDTTPDWVRNISWTASWNTLKLETAWVEVSTQSIQFTNNLANPWDISLDSNNIWVIAQTQVSTISLPRSIVSWDSVEVVINGITITQNFLSSSAISFNNLVSQINNLPDVSATSSWSDIIITADIAWTWFDISSIHFINNTNSITTISNVEAVAQKTEFSFPAPFVTWDVAKVKIDWNEVSENFATDSNTTLNNLISSITSSTNVTATLTWTLWIILEAKNPWTSFTVDSVSIENSQNPQAIQINVPWVAQVNEVIVPFVPTSSDQVMVNINWTIVSETWADSWTTKLSLLNTKIDNLASVNSSFDWNNIFTITSANAGTPFTAWLSALWATITSSWIQTNINSWAQVDELTVNRNLISWDVLDLSIAGQNISQNYSADKVTTLTQLTNQIDNLAEINATFDWNETITITAADAWIPFTSWVLNIYSTIPSVNQVANVSAVAQVDKLNLARSIIAWDSISLTVNWNNIGPVDFSWSNNNTLSLFANEINNSQSWVIATNDSSSITLTSSVAWTPFTASSFLLENNSLSSTTTNNVVAVKQVSEFEIPLFVEWDNISFTINWTWITENFDTDNTTTINAIIGKINALWVVDWVYNSASWTITVQSTTAWVPFTLSQVTIINTTPITEFIANITPVAQVVNMYPSLTLREWLTYRVTVNWQDYDYLTNSSDSVSNIINSLSTIITNTWVTVSSWSDLQWEYLSLISSVAWIAFSYNSQVLDVTAPIITTPINTPQILKIWDTSTSNVEINEDWTIYLVLSWTTVNTELDITSAIANHEAFIWKNNALSHSQYNITVPSWILDWVYNFVAVDDYSNVSQALPGWLTVDNTAPILNIITQSTTTKDSEILIEWTTEANTPITISWWSWVVNTTSDSIWAFSWIVALNENTVNNLTISSVDTAWNIGSWSISITQDNLAPNPLTVNIANPITNAPDWNIQVITEPNIIVSVYESWNIINSWTTSSGWEINFNLTLAQNTVNDFNVVATDEAWNESSSLITIIQDSINPNVIINPLPNSVHTWSINITWTTEANSNITITNSWNTIYWTSDWSWVFDINVPLYSNNWAQTTNIIDVTVVDQAGNTWTWNVTIIEDSIPNSLIINTPSQYTNQSSLTVSGSTKANASIIIDWGAIQATTTADNNWEFSINVSLNQDALNSLLITSLDSINNVATWSIDINQDSINPTVSIDTPTHPTNSLTINIFWSTEPDSTIVIWWWLIVANWVSDWSWSFNIPVMLNSWSINNLVVASTDRAWNTWTWNISITHDPIVIFVTHNWANVNYTNQASFSLSWTTKSWAQIAVTWWSWALLLTADGNWVFSWSIELNQNTSNIIDIVATDDTTNTANANFIIIHDDVIPSLQFDGLATITNQNDILVTWNTESWSTVSINNWWQIYNTTATASWTFSILLPLHQNVLNNINWTATDLAWNISSATWFSILNDNISPSVSWLNVSSNTVWWSMNINYIFSTDENSTSTFYIGSNSNVLSSLLFSWTTNWTSHSRVIPWFTPNTTYYYFITSTDIAWNTYQSSISTVNFIDNTWPSISDKYVDNITTTWATISFSYSDAHFNSWTIANWSVIVDDWTNSISQIPSLTYWSVQNNWSAIFNNLISWTNYSYTINLADDYWNTSSETWTFTTATNLILSWSNMTETWAVSLNNWTWWNLDMSWTTLTLLSSWNSWLWSGSLTIPGWVDIVYGSGWNFIIVAPSLLNSNSSNNANNSEVQSLVSLLNTSTMNYTPNIIQTIQAWWNVALSASWWNFNINTALINSQIWQTLKIYRSQDWVNWEVNSPDNQCVVTNNNTCNFDTNHFTFFTFVKPVWTVVNRVTWWGWSWLVKDYCPTWDYSSSYYDWSCGTKTIIKNDENSNNSWAIISNDYLNKVDSEITNKNIDQLANKFILKVKTDNYTNTVTTDQKIDLWKKVISKVDSELSKKGISSDKKELLTKIRTKAKSNLDKQVIISQEGNKKIAWNKENQYENSIEIKNVNWVYKIYKYINVENSVVTRDKPSYKWNIIDFLPRNFKVELVEFWNLWSKIKYNWWTEAYIRTSFLRDENREDRGRKVSVNIFYDTTIQADVDLRQIKVNHSVNVRRWPWDDYDVKTTLYNWEKVLILDSTKVSWRYEIRWNKWHGWVNNEFITKIEK